MIQGGGSARVHAASAGLAARRAARALRRRRSRSCTSAGAQLQAHAGARHAVLDGPLQVEYYAGREREGEPVLVEDGERGWFTFIGPVGAGVPDEFSMRVTGTFVAPESGRVDVRRSCRSAGRGCSIDGEVVVDNWNPTGRSDAFMGFGSAEVDRHDRSRRGRSARPRGRVRPGRAGAGWARDRMPAAGARDLLRPRGRAARARRRGRVRRRHRRRLGDRGQRPRVDGAAAAAGRARARGRGGEPAHGRRRQRGVAGRRCRGPTTSPRSCSAGSPGEEWGNALADVLAGDVSPSGKLPTTFPVRIEDTPAFTSYPGERGTGALRRGRVRRLPLVRRAAHRAALRFGHGLSYTTFELGDVAGRRPTTPDGARATCAVHQHRRACAARRSCSATCTTSKSSVARPPQELKAFAKVWLDPGETRDVVLALDDRAFAFWDVDAHEWTVEPGEFELRIGTSSRDIRAHRAHDRARVTAGAPTLTVGLANYGATYAPGSGTGSSTSAARPKTRASTASSSSTTS